MKIQKGDLVTVLRTLARMADQNILISSSVQGEIDLDVKDVPWNRIFMGILRTNGLSYKWEGSIIRVLTLEDLEHELKVKSLQTKQQEQQIDTDRAEPLLTRIIDIDYSDPEKMKENLKEFLIKDVDGNPRGSIMVDGHTNSLIIQAVKSDLDRIMSLIETLDRPTPQILISANIVEATKDTARKLGIQWGGVYSTDTSGNNTLSITSGTSDYAVDFPVRDEDILAAGGIASLGVLFGKTGSNYLDLQLTALEEEGTLNILSTPSITTLDNQTAFTENGERVPYVSTDHEGNRQVKFEDAVLRLEITPHVIDDETLKMKIIVKKDEVDTSRTVDGNPLIVKKMTETSLITSNGETIVISGLTKQTKNVSDRGVPFLKNIPLLGYLFKGENKADKMEEVLIFITPRILEKHAPDSEG
jgi:type IV pilus assembly protein PilQ